MSSESKSESIEKWNSLYINAIKSEPPSLLTATIVHGFKRGSKELGIPTANLDMDELGEEFQTFKLGIYYGWAKMNNGDIHRCVVSVGWNPYYKNEKITIEAHLLTNLEDFYGEKLSVLICGYLRDECNFTSLEDLISCINEDIRRCNVNLDTDASIGKYKDTSTWPVAIRK